MTPTDTAQLSRECEVFCRYLIGRVPGAYVQEKYREAHVRSADYASTAAFDRVFLSFAARGPVFARLADSYACLFARYSLFRRKLILLFAILESASAQHGYSDTVDGSRQPVLFAKIAFRGVLFALRLALACLIFLPLRLVLGGTPFVRREGH